MSARAKRPPPLADHVFAPHDRLRAAKAVTRDAKVIIQRHLRG